MGCENSERSEVRWELGGVEEWRQCGDYEGEPEPWDA